MNLTKELDIKITEDDRLWMETLYTLVVEHQEVTYKKIRATLYNQIARDYDPNGIDNRLCYSKGTDLTLVAAELLHPERKYLEKTNTLVEEIKSKILNDPEVDHIDIQEILNVSSLEHDDVDVILKLIRRYGKFYSGSSSLVRTYDIVRLC